MEKKIKTESVKFLYGYFKRYRLQLLGVLLALLVSSSALLSLGWGIRYLIDQGFKSNDSSLLDKALLVLFAVTTMLALASYSRYYLITRIGDSIIADMRQDIFAKVLSFSPAFFDKERTGRVVSKFTADTTLIQTLVTTVFSQLVRNSLTFAGGLIILFITSPKLTLYVLFILPLAIMPIIILGKRVRRLSATAQEKVGDISSHVEETISALKTVQAYGREELEIKKFLGYIKSAVAASGSRIKLRASLTGLVIFLTLSSVGIVLWIGGHEVLAGKLSAGALSAFIFYSIVSAGALGSISDVMSDIHRALGAADGMAAILHTEPEIVSSVYGVRLPKHAKGSLEFKDVTFFYPSKKDKPALNHISFHIRQGEKIAIVGLSGAGKSTIFQLALRFYDPASGKVLFDGIDIKDIELKSLRDQYAIVSQEPFIFSGTAAENIAYGRLGATRDEIIAAAKDAMAEGFIAKLPQGFDTYLGEKGIRLSGGEKQRIAIARAMLKKPKILLLDEATNALDAENEKMVQKALDRLMADCTTIIIAHRLSTVLKSDRIMVLNEGRIEEEGSHSYLIGRDGLYSRLAQLQLDTGSKTEDLEKSLYFLKNNLLH